MHETDGRLKWKKKLLNIYRFPQSDRLQECVANIVLVLTKDMKVRLCVDYRVLNQVSPQDDLPLSNIDVHVDNTAVILYSPSWIASHATIKLGLPQKIKKKLHYLSLGNFWLQSHVVWSKECKSHISEGNDRAFS